jgi:hypothetical protein
MQWKPLYEIASQAKPLFFRLKSEFTNCYLNLPHEKLRSAAEEVLALSDDQIFFIKP